MSPPGTGGSRSEIYEHGSPLMAYGIYAQMRSPGLALHAIGNEAFSDEYSINFWKDRFYVRVAVFEKGEESDAALDALREGDRGRDTGGRRRAARGNGRVPRGRARAERPPLSHAGRPRAGEVPSRLRGHVHVRTGSTGKLYLATLVDSAAARDTFEWYTDEMESFLATAEGAKGDYILGLGKDPYQGDVLVFSFGRYLGVLAGIKNPAERGTELVKKMVERLGAIEAAPLGKVVPSAPKN